MDNLKIEQDQAGRRSIEESYLDELAAEVRAAAQELEHSWRPLDEVLGPAPLPGDWPAYELPDGYGLTRVVLLVRDPYWLHSYWEIGPEEAAALRAETGREIWELPKILRVHNLSDIGAGYDLQVGCDPRHWYLETGRPGQAFQVELGVDAPGKGFRSIARSNQVTTPIDRVAELVDTEWMAVEEDFRRLYQLSAGMGSGPNSAELMESLSHRLARSMGSSAISSLGSGFRLPGPVRHFWLVVNAELIIHGATQPDARVTIEGRPLQLRQDGTFSARFALPDGRRSIPVCGRSADGIDEITITPTVEKRTH